MAPCACSTDAGDAAVRLGREPEPKRSRAGADGQPSDSQSAAGHAPPSRRGPALPRTAAEHRGLSCQRADPRHRIRCAGAPPRGPPNTGDKLRASSMLNARQLHPLVRRHATPALPSSNGFAHHCFHTPLRTRQGRAEAEAEARADDPPSLPTTAGAGHRRRPRLLSHSRQRSTAPEVHSSAGTSHRSAPLAATDGLAEVRAARRVRRAPCLAASNPSAMRRPACSRRPRSVSTLPPTVRRTPGISCEAPIRSGFVSFIPLFDGVAHSCARLVRSDDCCAPCRHHVQIVPPESRQSRTNATACLRTDRASVDAARRRLPRRLTRTRRAASAAPGSPAGRRGRTPTLRLEPEVHGDSRGHDLRDARARRPATVTTSARPDFALAATPISRSIARRHGRRRQLCRPLSVAARDCPSNTGDKLQSSNTLRLCQLHPLVRRPARSAAPRASRAAPRSSSRRRHDSTPCGLDAASRRSLRRLASCASPRQLQRCHTAADIARLRRRARRQTACLSQQAQSSRREASRSSSREPVSRNVQPAPTVPLEPIAATTRRSAAEASCSDDRQPLRPRRRHAVRPTQPRQPMRRDRSRRAAQLARPCVVHRALRYGPPNTGDKLRSGARVRPGRRGHEAACPFWQPCRRKLRQLHPLVRRLARYSRRADAVSQRPTTAPDRTPDSRRPRLPHATAARAWHERGHGTTWPAKAATPRPAVTEPKHRQSRQPTRAGRPDAAAERVDRASRDADGPAAATSCRRHRRSGNGKRHVGHVPAFGGVASPRRVSRRRALLRDTGDQPARRSPRAASRGRPNTGDKLQSSNTLKALSASSPCSAARRSSAPSALRSVAACRSADDRRALDDTCDRVRRTRCQRLQTLRVAEPAVR